MDIQYPEDIIGSKGRQFLQKVPKGLSSLVFLLLPLLWLATGFYLVNPGETGVVRRFGQEVRKTEPGLSYRRRHA